MNQYKTARRASANLSELSIRTCSCSDVATAKDHTPRSPMLNRSASPGLSKTRRWCLESKSGHSSIRLHFPFPVSTNPTVVTVFISGATASTSTRSGCLACAGPSFSTTPSCCFPKTRFSACQRCLPRSPSPYKQSYSPQKYYSPARYMGVES